MAVVEQLIARNSSLKMPIIFNSYAADVLPKGDGAMSQSWRMCETRYEHLQLHRVNSSNSTEVRVRSYTSSRSAGGERDNPNGWWQNLTRENNKMQSVLVSCTRVRGPNNISDHSSTELPLLFTLPLSSKE
jgi:hypothetical protein